MFRGSACKWSNSLCRGQIAIVASLEHDGTAWVVRHAADDEIKQELQALEAHISAYRTAPAAEPPDLNATLLHLEQRPSRAGNRVWS
jgi:hypothetical protein